MDRRPNSPTNRDANTITTRFLYSLALGLLVLVASLGCTGQPTPSKPLELAPSETKARAPEPTPPSGPSPTPVATATRLPAQTSAIPLPEPVPTATSLAPPALTTEPPEPTRTPTPAEFALTLGDDITWLDAFNTFTPSERDCVRDSLEPDQLETMLKYSIVSASMEWEEWEVPLFSCLLPERADGLLVNSIIVGLESDGLSVSENGAQCLATWVAGVDVARLIAAVDSDQEVAEKTAYDIFACFRDSFEDLAMEAMETLSGSELGESEKSCLRHVLEGLPGHAFTVFFFGLASENPAALQEDLNECAPGILGDLPQEFVEETVWDIWWSEPEAGRFTMVDTMADQSCGLLDTGGIVCWGFRSEGGNPPTEGTFVSVSVGDWHACALTEDGEAVCWGIDEYGQVTPPGDMFSSLDVGLLHTCGVRTGDGTALCWGENWAGQTDPIPDGVYVSVSSGWDFSCGLRTDGNVVCWGSDASGQSSPPEAVFTQVSAGEDHACGVTPDGPVLCWGYDEKKADPPPWHFQSVSAGVHHTCGVQGGGQVVCWGENADGQSTPPPGARFSSVSAAWDRTCGVSLDGRVACWGYGGSFD